MFTKGLRFVTHLRGSSQELEAILELPQSNRRRHEIHRRNAEVRETGRGGFASRGSGAQVRCSAHPQPARNAEEERRGLSQSLSDPRNMQSSKGQRGSDGGYGPEYGIAMPCLSLFRERKDKDWHDEAIRDAESAFRFSSLGP